MIKIEWPPNIEQIAEAFPHVDAAFNTHTMPKDHPDRAPGGILFAYGEDIYNPSGVRIVPALMAHEYRHCARQFATSAKSWWESYLTDPEFRYGEELLAHVDEYIAQAKHTNDRNVRAKLQQQTAKRLVAPLYNYQPPRSLAQAMRDIHLLAH